MSGFRAYFEPSKPPVAGDIIELSEAESRHLCGSLRASNGDKATIFNLNGAIALCEISSVSKTHALLKVLCPCSNSDPKANISLAICLPASSVFDEILRQAVEIGASELIPLLSENSQVRLSGKDAEKKMSKWRIKLIEAVKQSANFSPMNIRAISRIDSFLESSAGAFDAKFCASLQPNAKPILKSALDVIKSAHDKVCVLIGPEGDLSEREYALADKAGFYPVSLGENVMKCDTACACALSILKAATESKLQQQ